MKTLKSKSGRPPARGSGRRTSPKMMITTRKMMRMKILNTLIKTSLNMYVI